MKRAKTLKTIATRHAGTDVDVVDNLISSNYHSLLLKEVKLLFDLCHKFHLLIFWQEACFGCMEYLAKKKKSTK